MVGDEGSKGINEQASYAATKLRQLYDKLEYKRQALGSIQNAPKPDKKVTEDKQMWQNALWGKIGFHSKSLQQDSAKHTNTKLSDCAHPDPSSMMPFKCQDVNLVVEVLIKRWL